MTDNTGAMRSVEPSDLAALLDSLITPHDIAEIIRASAIGWEEDRKWLERARMDLRVHKATCALPNPRLDREAEYRRVWLEVAMRLYSDPSPDALPLEKCFAVADRFLAELKKRDGA